MKIKKKKIEGFYYSDQLSMEYFKDQKVEKKKKKNYEICKDVMFL